MNLLNNNHKAQRQRTIMVAAVLSAVFLVDLTIEQARSQWFASPSSRPNPVLEVA
jgi:hypothetical protein